MAKITKEQFKKWNAQACNGFVFDLKKYLMWGEKTLVKQIDIDDTHMIQFALEYIAELEERQNAYRDTFTVATGKHEPALTITRWVKSDVSDFYTSQGWSKKIKVGEARKTKDYKTLCACSGQIDTDAYIKDIELI